MNAPLISVCIPAYQRTGFLKRLLNSVAVQQYPNFEVVVTDDSPDGSVTSLVDTFKDRLAIAYYKNPRQLGTPENWNESIRRARGEWIKVMHDDDWFSGADALSQFAAAIVPGRNFIYSAYENVNEDTGAAELVRASVLSRKILAANPVALLSTNLVGPPSVTLYRKTALEYDKRMKWRVDIDFYVHYLQNNSFTYISNPLVKIGISREQVTQSCFLVPEVEIPENFLLLEKIGARSLKNIFAYDSWWRLMRNLHIRSLQQVSDAGFRGEVPAVIRSIIGDQRPFSAGVLKIGIVSKMLMLASYLRRSASIT